MREGSRFIQLWMMTKKIDLMHLELLVLVLLK
jgi:hypothetical protein